MLIVHVNADPIESSGGASAALRSLVECQRCAGVDMTVLSRADLPLSYRILHLVARLVMKILFGHCYSGGLLPTGLARRANALRPDLVCLHRLQLGTLGMSELLQIKAPIRWYFHDLWPLNGVCPYWREDLFELPMPRRMRWLDRRSRRLKKQVVEQLGERLTVVVASEWMRQQVQSHAGFSKCKVEVEPLPVNPVFKDGELPRTRTLLFVAGARVDSPVKGYDRLMSAMAVLSEREREQIELKVVQGLPPERLAEEYRTAAAVAIPSHQETYSLVKHEAWACGCPVIVFNETACPEGVVQGVNGWIASDEKEFAKGIVHFCCK